MAFKVFSAFLIGLLNSINVFSLSSLFVFLILNDLWVVYRGSRAKTFIYILFFVLWVGNFVYAIGVLDFLVSSEFIELGLKVFNVALAVIFFVLGVFNFQDWVSLKKNNDLSKMKVWPIYVIKDVKKQLNAKVLIILAVLLGVLLTIIAVLWPQNSSLYDLIREPLIGRDLWGTYGLFLSYALGITAPIIILSEFWLMFDVRRIENLAALVKISIAGFLLATSLGLGFVIYRI